MGYSSQTVSFYFIFFYLLTPCYHVQRHCQKAQQAEGKQYET